MRYVDITALVIDATWIADAEAASGVVRHTAPGDRSATINKNQHIWSSLKGSLQALSYNKCWYCESIDPRSDNAVDHYRPKGNVKDSQPPHDGYWWLAFSPGNYRFSCMYCNSIRKSGATSGGKHDYFPLWDETVRARSEQDDLDEEMPLLLDPTSPLDVRLISFDDDGRVGPAYDESKPREHRMAKESILRYHLNHPIIVEQRMMQMLRVRRWVEEADQYFHRYERKDDGVSKSVLRSAMARIMAAIHPRSPYSAAIRCLLAGLAPRSEVANIVMRTP